MMSKKLWLATLGSIGYAPMPGTMATFIALPFVWVVQLACGVEGLFLLASCAVAFCAWLVIRSVLDTFFGRPDPRMIVLDEVVGTFFTFLSVPLSCKTAMLGVFLFRFFDITKWGGISYLERFRGAFGVVIDDIGSGILSNIIMRLIFHYAWL